MNKYEAMFILKPDLSEQDRESLFNQIKDTVSKNNGSGLNGSIWLEKRKLFFPLKRYREGLYYLLNFSIEPGMIQEIRQAYKLNENILRVLITRLDR